MGPLLRVLRFAKLVRFLTFFENEETYFFCIFLAYSLFMSNFEPRFMTRVSYTI
jgi:hypothetical protein